MTVAARRLFVMKFAVHSSGSCKQPPDKIVEASLLPFEVDRFKLKVSASVGAAYDAELEGGWKGLVSRANAKVYEAKAAGRARRIVANFEDPELNRSAG
jgi:GGDEF domain-containing protein